MGVGASVGVTVIVGVEDGIDVAVEVFVGDGEGLALGVGVCAGATRARECSEPAARRLYPLPATRAGKSCGLLLVPLPSWP